MTYRFPFRGLLFGWAFSFLILAAGVVAADATWNVNPTSDWNPAANWTPNTVPNGPRDVATFANSNNAFQVSYSGGDGNDLTLTVVQ